MKNQEGLSQLKVKFRSLERSEREQIGICFLKVKLGVHQPDEFTVVSDFLSGFDMEINDHNLDAMMDYLHSESKDLPKFVEYERSLSREIHPDLAPYDPDDVETLREDSDS